MKADIVLRLAVWLVEHWGGGPVGQALAGDLLESYRDGHSRWWCFAQALWRLADVAELRVLTLLATAFYCAAFVLLHPLWQRLSAISPERHLGENITVTAWPASSLVEIATGLGPAALFVWIGVLVFLCLQSMSSRRLDLLRVLLALSVSLTVVFVGSLLRLRNWHYDLRVLSRADFYYPYTYAHFSGPLFLALFAAVAMLPRDRRHRRPRYTQRLTRSGVLQRVVHCFGLTALIAPQIAAQSIKPQGTAAKEMVQLIGSFDSSDWTVFHSAYLASFVHVPPDVPIGREFFRHRTEGLDIRKLEEDTPTEATLLVQEHASDQFQRIHLQVEANEPHRIIELQMEPIERPVEFPYGSLTDAEIISQARARLHALADAGKFSGVMVIQRDGKIVYSDAIGEADRARRIPNTMASRFRIGSMNKMFTAVAILQLVAAGKLQLDTPIGHYLPDYPNKDAAAKVTVRHLLTHTGGTGDFFGPDFEAHRESLRTHEDFVALFGPRALRFEPGTRFEYSNYGFYILGALIDRVSGQDYYHYVHDHVYAPAGMVNTGSEPEDVVVPGRVVGYTQVDGKAWHPNDATLPYRGASAGGGYTTAGDLLRFADALESHKLLSAENMHLLLTPSGIHGGGESYGFGFAIEREPSGTCFGHTGGGPGQTAMLSVCPEARYTIVWLSNTDPPGALLLTEYLLHRLPQR